MASRASKNTQARLIWKTVVVSIVVVGTNVIGNYALKSGLTQIGVIATWSPLPYIQTFINPWVGVGVACMLAWLTSRLALLSWADLSYVLPITSFSYVLSAVAGALYLHESVNWVQWAGISVITVGTALVTFTYPETTKKPEPSI